MKAFLLTFPDSVMRRYSDDKVDKWWDKRNKPQADSIKKLNTFFRKLAEDQNLVWKDHWITKTLDELENENELYGPVRKYKQPYALARFHKDYVDENRSILDYTIDKYCHQYFYIYHIHTETGMLVRNVLKFHGHSEEKIFCNFYAYSKHVIEKQKYVQWQNIERWHGNIFFNNSCLNIVLVTPDFDNEQGPQYNQIVIPRLHNHQERVGVMMGLTDQSESPVALPVLIQRTEYTQVPPDDMSMHVREINVENGDSPEKIEDILKKLGPQKIIIEQPENANVKLFKF